MVTDIDECDEKTHTCAQICQNTIPDYECVCERGYKMNGSDECVGEWRNYITGWAISKYTVIAQRASRFFFIYLMVHAMVWVAFIRIACTFDY